MGVAVLYGIAAFMETGIGIWIFGQAFPKRERMEKRHICSEWLLFLGISMCAYTFPNLFFEIKDSKKYIGNLLAAHMIVTIIYAAYKTKKTAWGKQEEDIIQRALFGGMTVCMWCQFWNSYQSYMMTLAGNIFPVFYLWAFYKCSLNQAYLWQFVYATNLGMLKNIYITFGGLYNDRSFEDFFYWPRNHTYGEILCLLAIYIILILAGRYIPIKDAVAKLLEEHKKVLFMFAFVEWGILIITVDNGLGGSGADKLAASLIITGSITFCVMILYIRAIVRTADAEKKLLDMRNEIVENQYYEIKEAYECYRCMIHDEKHMLLYLKECLDNGDLLHARKLVNSYQRELHENGRCRWTGIQKVDFILSIKKQKLDELSIKLRLDCQTETIPMDDADFVVVFSNLLDNAIEAAEKCGVSDRRIEVVLKNVNSMFYFKMANGCSSEPTVRNQRFQTSKKEGKGHGWGLESVKHIVEKYKGELSFNYSDAYFEVSIIMNVNESKGG